MGREEEIAYAREHGIPVKGGTEVAPYSIDDNLWGRSSEGRWIEDLDHAPEDDVFQLVTRPEEAPDEARGREASASRRGCRSRSTASGSSLVELLERAAELGDRTGSGSSTTSRTGSSASRCATSTRCPPRRSILTAHEELERLVGTIHQNQFKPRAGPEVGLPRLRRALVGAAARRPRRLHGARSTRR